MSGERFKVYSLCLLVTVWLSACGFQLRGSNGSASLPFHTIYLAIPAASPLTAELKRNIRASGSTQISSDQKSAQVILEVLSELPEKTILAMNSQGRVREYTLNYKLRFRVRDGKDQELLAPTEIALKRDISYNEAQALAKEKEEEMYYRDMRTDMVQQILRRLSAIKLN